MELEKLNKILLSLLKIDNKYSNYKIEICNFSKRSKIKEYFEINEEDKEIYIYDIEK